MSTPGKLAIKMEESYEGKWIMTEERFCEHVIYLVHAPLRVYDESGERRVYVDGGGQVDILEKDQEFERFLLQKGREEWPILYIEQEHIAYGIIVGNGSRYILGPCCLDRKQLSLMSLFLKKHKISTDIFYRIGYIELSIFSEIVVMLYEMATGLNYDREQLKIKSFCDSQMEHNLLKQRQKVFHERQEEALPHNPYSQDIHEQESIEKGDMEGLYKSFQESYIGKVGCLANDEIRSEKNLSIGGVAVSCRSAIRGGVLPEIAFSMSDAYIRQIEEVKKTGEASAIARKAEIDFCQMVQEAKTYGKQSQIVRRCKELILQYLHTKLSAKDLAKELNVTPGYLSQVFKKEEGITLTDYIANEKIKFAKDQLIYTSDSYETIAYTYGFASQSHFGSIFKRYTGMTLGEFRRQNQKYI